MPSLPVLTELSPAEFIGELDPLLAIYADAMGADPDGLPGRREVMRRHAGYPAFRAVTARLDREGPVVGFAYGFHGAGGQWWHDAVWSALSWSLGLTAAAHWLADCMELAEIHVLTPRQRMGIGTRLMLAMTAGRPERTVMLSTPDRETTARRLYRRLGFSDLMTGYSFPGGSPPYAIMGALLPLRDPIAADSRPRSASPSI